MKPYDRCNAMFCNDPSVIRIQKQRFCLAHADVIPDLEEKDRVRVNALLEKAERKRLREEKAAARLKEKKEKETAKALARESYLSNRATVVLTLDGKVIAKGSGVHELIVPPMFHYAKFKSRKLQRVAIMIETMDRITQLSDKVYNSCTGGVFENSNGF